VCEGKNSSFIFSALAVGVGKNKCAVCAFGFFSLNVQFQHDLRITYNGKLYK